MTPYVLGFQDIDTTKLALVGGKGANLGELSRIEGIRVPDGFCVTIRAYEEVIASNVEISSLVDELCGLTAGHNGGVREISAMIRKAIEAVAVPSGVVDQIARHLDRLGVGEAYAVRSSATAEDLPTASFAGQQDTYLNVVGIQAVLRIFRKCWASLFNDRAVAYRIQNGFDHRKVQLSVVIQRMVFPLAAGILFTADPVTSNRKVTSIDASFGLGEALVAGLVNPDNYKVRDGEIVGREIGTKRLAIFACKDGGTEQKEVEDVLQNAQTLEDDQILQLERMGRTIEAHFGQPQDIEWCLSDDGFFVVQSRPITTLYPVPIVSDDKNHVYMSFSHQQMMTDAMKPLGVSFFLGQLGYGDDQGAYLIPIGGRLYFDVSKDLSSVTGRAIMLGTLGAIDPLMLDAVKNVLQRKSFVKTLARGGKGFLSGTAGYFTWRLPVEAIKAYRKNDSAVVDALIAEKEAAVGDLRERFARLSGDDVFASLPDLFNQLKEAAASPSGIGLIYAGQFAMRGVNKNMEKWLGEKGIADSLTRSVANNPTSDMGLALLDVADVVRQYPAVMDGLQHAKDATFFEDLAKLEGGVEAGRAIRAFLELYGMRCPGEIDITKPRWSEEPTALAPMILSNIRNFAPGGHQVVFEEGRLASERTEQDLMSRLERLPGGRRKAEKTDRQISILRNYAGYREYPKYLMMQYYWIIKQALLREAAKLAEEGVVAERDDVDYLTLEEFRDAVRTKRQDQTVIDKRKAEFEVFEKLTPPRVMTSEGEVITGQYATGGIPVGALAGIAASSGTVEGRARVVTRMEDADIEEGDILVTNYTDPSWTPLFVSIKALVTEVGGMGTHGSVVAREYGLPAVVGVEGATRLIADGQQIRVNGTGGYVEVLP